MIRQPKGGGTAGRDRECEEAMEYPFNAIIDGLTMIAEAAGWKAHEIDQAVLKLAHNRINARLSMEKIGDDGYSLEDLLLEEAPRRKKTSGPH